MAFASPEDREVLAGIFAARVKLAKISDAQAAKDAVREWEDTRKWVDSSSTAVGSFIWYCEEFNQEVSAVRRAIERARAV